MNHLVKTKILFLMEKINCQIEVNNEIFICKNNDNNWIVPNPDNIIFK